MRGWERARGLLLGRLDRGHHPVQPVSPGLLSLVSDAPVMRFLVLTDRMVLPGLVLQRRHRYPLPFYLSRGRGSSLFSPFLYVFFLPLSFPCWTQVFGGECAAGSSVDATTCSECSAGPRELCSSLCVAGGRRHPGADLLALMAGFFCQNGIQTPCKTQCPSPIQASSAISVRAWHARSETDGRWIEQEMRGECKAGSVEDTVECVSAGTPPPAVSWTFPLQCNLSTCRLIELRLGLTDAGGLRVV